MGAEAGFAPLPVRDFQDIRDQHPEEGPTASTGNTSGVELRWRRRHRGEEQSDRVYQELGNARESLHKYCGWPSNLSLYTIDRTIFVLQRWFTDALDVLKAVPELPLSPTTPLRLMPMSAVTPYTAGVPFLRPLDPSEPLQLPLSKEMSM